MGIPLRIAIILAMFVVIGSVIYWSSLHGPDEKFRIVHPSGYSVVRPSDWNARFVIQPAPEVSDAIDLSPIQAWKGREPVMWVKRLSHPADVEALKAKGFLPARFLSFDGVMQTEAKKWYTVRVAIFKARDDWFDVGVSLPNGEDVRIDDWWQYMQTFQPAPAQRQGG